MKIRSDFVTNSSSSSFIACFAKVEDIDKAKEVIGEEILNLLIEGKPDIKNMLINDGKGYLIHGQDILDYVKDPTKDYYDFMLKEWIRKNEDLFCLENASWCDVSIILEIPRINPEALYFYYSLFDCAGETDSDFWDEELEELNYDVTVDDLCPEARKVYDFLIEENGFSEIQKQFGAGRDG